MKSMYPKPLWGGTHAADASAAGAACQIGGFLFGPDGSVLWFSERFDWQTFSSLGIPVHREMQRDIACFETLAQMAIVFVLHQRILFNGWRSL